MGPNTAPHGARCSRAVHGGGVIQSGRVISNCQKPSMSRGHLVLLQRLGIQQQQLAEASSPIELTSVNNVREPLGANEYHWPILCIAQTSSFVIDKKSDAELRSRCPTVASTQHRFELRLDITMTFAQRKKNLMGTADRDFRLSRMLK